MSINWDKTDRARMLDFLRHWRGDRRYQVSIGEHDRRAFDVLSDEALAALVMRIVRDFWIDQRDRRRRQEDYPEPAAVFPNFGARPIQASSLVSEGARFGTQRGTHPRKGSECVLNGF